VIPSLVFQAERERELRLRLAAIGRALLAAQCELELWREEIAEGACEELRAEIAEEWRGAAAAIARANGAQA